MPREDLTFESHGERCAAWHYGGEGEEFAGEAGRPCVVMAHGFGHTRADGLEPFAERLAAEGLDVVVLDYRCFGDSSGEPRQLIDWRRHREDYHSALRFARALDGVDPERMILWGTSYSGGHALAVAADDGRVAAVLAMVPAFDGLAAVLALRHNASIGTLLRAELAAVRDQIAALRGAEPVRIPIMGEPGTLAAMSAPGAFAGSQAIQAPDFRNEYCARAVLFAALNRPFKRAAELPCPMLVQICDNDSIAPPASAEKGAWLATGRAEVRHYGGEHFDLYVGDGREHALADQLHFLRRHIARGPARAGAGAGAGQTA